MQSEGQTVHRRRGRLAWPSTSAGQPSCPRPLSQRPRPGKDPGPLARNQQHARKGLCVAVGGWGGAGGTVPGPCPAGAGRTGSYTVTEDRSVSPTLPFHTGNAEAQRSKVTFPGQTAKLGPGSESLDPTQGRGDLKVRSLPGISTAGTRDSGEAAEGAWPPAGLAWPSGLEDGREEALRPPGGLQGTCCTHQILL